MMKCMPPNSALRKFGLVPEGFEYRPFIIKLLTEQVAGYYDAKAARVLPGRLAGVGGPEAGDGA